MNIYDEYLDLTAQPPTSTVIIKKESRFRNWWGKVKANSKLNNVYLWMSLFLNIELAIALIRIIAVI